MDGPALGGGTIAGATTATLTITGSSSKMRVNATDRSVAVGVWTSPGVSCPTDLNGDGFTNATDRSILVGAWTGGGNCAP